MINRLLKYFLLVATVSVGAALLYGSQAHAVNYGDYPGGQASIQQIDRTCSANFWNAAASSGSLKTITNGSAYFDQQWISADNTGVTTINVDAGSTAPVTLRINHLVYICYVSINPGSNNLAAIKARMATPQAFDGHDDSPAPWSGYQNSPNRTHYGFGLYGLSTSTGGVSIDPAASTSTVWPGSISIPGQQIIGNYTNATRFWHISYAFRYQPPPGGFTGDTDVTINATVSWINQYYERGTAYKNQWQIDCIGKKWNDSGVGIKPPANHNSLPDSWFTDQCGRSNLGLTFRVHVNQNYNLTPKVTGSKTVVSVGDTVTPTPSVNNAAASGGTTKSASVDWSLVQFTVAPGATIPKPANDSDLVTGTIAPETYYKNQGGQGSTLVKTGNQVFDAGDTSITGYGAQVVGDYPVGTRVCWALSVKPYIQTSSDWRYGKPYCVTIAKSPRVQVWGSDLWVGAGGITSNVITSLTGRSSDNKTYGSWAEYAIAASGTSKTMASGSALNNGTAGTPWSGKNCSVVKETFTNAGSSGCGGNTIVGGYNTLNSLPNVSASFKVTNGPLPGSSVDVSTLVTGVYSGSGTISLSAATLSNKWIVINAPGATVNITGDLKYTNATLNSAASLPQLVIIANTINIAGGVKQVDAWLVARPTGANTSAPNGSIYTCSDVANASSLNANTCSNSLTVNGPVSAQHLFLYRTAGAGTGNSIGDPAEVFNLRPDAYMWAYQRASASNQVSTMQTKELPPRF